MAARVEPKEWLTWDQPGDDTPGRIRYAPLDLPDIIRMEACLESWGAPGARRTITAEQAAELREILAAAVVEWENVLEEDGSPAPLDHDTKVRFLRWNPPAWNALLRASMPRGPGVAARRNGSGAGSGSARPTPESPAERESTAPAGPSAAPG